jgi:CHASE3 domain sensor protein
MTSEEDEAFGELERKLGRKEVTTAMENLNHELDVYRNEVIEEVAQEIERFTFAFGTDTVNSFVIFIRGLKNDE